MHGGDAMIVMFFSSLIRGLKRERNAFSRGYDDMASKINSLRSQHNEYDPSLVFTARAKLIGAYQGSEKDFREYQNGIRDATTVYEREFGAP
jgi:hypothetical protein